MNTPSTPKRWTGQFSWPHGPDEALSHTVSDEKILAKIGEIIVAFGHLEQHMRDIMSILIGGPHYAGSIISDAIMSAKTRTDIMRRLLQEMPENAERPKHLDDVLDDFLKINKRRNDYVHGLWYTAEKSKLVMRCGTDGLGLSFMRAKPVSIDEMETLLDDISNLNRRIWDLRLIHVADGD